MELGGNGPVVILDDADLDRAASATAAGCFVNAGQVCSSSERILVQRKVYDGFAERMAAAARAIVLGDPRRDGVTMGPLNNSGVAAKVASHVSDALARGARPLVGGRPAVGLGTELYFEPTVLTGVPADALINREETFGPVAPLIAFDSDEEAMALAADNRYGLVSSIFTRDIDRAFRYIDEMPTGVVNVNDTSNYWELHIPFGGLTGKESGTGRVGGRHAMTAMCDLKTATFSVA
jgi:acyl-CoA reductase-like NAD-dependent aldehyde dehydrogenase